MEYKPHDYQQFAINYILEHPIAAVILGMGLGKTSITLTAIEQLIYDSFEVSKVLVVAPLRVARNTWSDEIHKWNHLKHLRYSIVLGSAAERKKALEADADIYIINRENLQWLIEQSGVNFFWDMVVLDELSSFKNWNSKRFKAFMKVRPKVKRVIGLTGTPSSNGLMDLFAEFKCLDMGERLGRFISQYRVNYFVPDRMNGPIVYSYKLRNGAEEQIYEKISDITISMKALDHLRMPEFISNEYPVYMNDEEAKFYADMEENAKEIRKVFDDTGYLIDTHTGVAAAVYEQYKAKTGDTTKTVIASTASPYKFSRSVMEAVLGKKEDADEFALIDEMERISGVKIPQAIEEIRDAKILHNRQCKPEEMEETVKQTFSK